MFCIAICDDEEYFQKRVQQLIMNYMDEKGYKCKIDIFSSGEEMTKLGTDISKYSIIFLDINMKELDGIETAKQIRKITKDTYIVFVTAFITYSLEGYKVDAIRYLLKDDDNLEKTISECLDTILFRMDYKVYKHTFEFQEGRIEIYLDDLVYVDSNLHKLTFHVNQENEKKYTMYERLDVIDEILQEEGFCRIHKSYLVNLNYVESIERYKVLLTNGNSLAVSKARFSNARDELICYKGEI